jgi:hypothetical protein
MIFYLLWLLPRPYNYYGYLTILAWLTGVAAICLWFKNAMGRDEDDQD